MLSTRFISTLSKVGMCGKTQTNLAVRYLSSLQSEVKINEPQIIESSTQASSNSKSNKPQVSLSIINHPYKLNARSKEEEVTHLRTANSVFAVMTILGKQHKVSKDDMVVIDKMKNVDIGQIVDIDKVLLVGDKNSTLLGHPFVVGAKVKVEIEEMTKDKKVISIKFRRRKNSRRRQGHRRELTILRVKEIILTSEVENDAVNPAV